MLPRQTCGGILPSFQAGGMAVDNTGSGAGENLKPCLSKLVSIWSDLVSLFPTVCSLCVHSKVF